MKQLAFEVLTYIMQLIMITGFGYACNWIRHIASQEKNKKYAEFALLAVKSVEQQMQGFTGESKKQIVKDWLVKTIKVSPKIVDAFVESAVYEMNKAKKEGEQSG